MSFFAILFALLIEQIRPLGHSTMVHDMARGWMDWAKRNFDAGKTHYAGLAWAVSVAAPVLLVLVVDWTLTFALGWPFAVAWNVAILYLTLGFRQFSHHFTAIRDALEAGDEPLARELLAKWKRVDVAQLPSSEIVRLVVRHSVISAHRHVFGVLAWYSVAAALGLGSGGAVLYRLAEFAQRHWMDARRDGPEPASAALLQVATSAWRVVDWLPVRLTAFGFAVVGSFEDAIDRWRQHAQRFPGDNDGVLLAATEGALNVRLDSDPVAAGDDRFFMKDPAPPGADPSAGTTGWREPQIAHLAQVVGLVWRTVVMWMVLLALLTLAHLLG